MNNTKSIQFLEINGEIIESDFEMAEALNNYFVEQSTLDESNASLPEFQPPNHEVLENIIISDEDVIEAINMVKPNKASGPDLISPRLFKEGANQLVLPLRNLFNLSLILGEFPASWKRSNVTAIHKKTIVQILVITGQFHYLIMLVN